MSDAKPPRPPLRKGSSELRSDAHGSSQAALPDMHRTQGTGAGVDDGARGEPLLEIEKLRSQYRFHVDQLQSSVGAVEDMVSRVEISRAASKDVVRTLATELRINKNKVSNDFMKLLSCSAFSEGDSLERLEFGELIQNYRCAVMGLQSEYRRIGGDDCSELSFTTVPDPASPLPDLENQPHDISSNAALLGSGGLNNGGAGVPKPHTVQIPELAGDAVAGQFSDGDFFSGIRNWCSQRERATKEDDLNVGAPAFHPKGTNSTPTVGGAEALVIARSVGGLYTKSSLMSTPSSPFSGDPTEYTTWRAILKLKMDDGNMNSLERIACLRTQTVGEAHELVENFSILAGGDPEGVEALLWSKLEERFGRVSQVATAIRAKIKRHPVIRDQDFAKLRTFADMLSVISFQQGRISELSILDTSSGQEEIRAKLPLWVQIRYQKFAAAQERQTGIGPSFKSFCDFLTRISDETNNPSYVPLRSGGSSTTARVGEGRSPNVFATEIAETQEPVPSVLATTTGRMVGSAPRTMVQGPVRLNAAVSNSSSRGYPGFAAVSGKSFAGFGPTQNCPLHPNEKHHLTQCAEFKNKSVEDRERIAYESRACYRCLCLGHVGSGCRKQNSCGECSAYWHHTMLHREVNDSSKRGKQVDTDVQVQRTDADSARQSFSKPCSQVYLVRVGHKDCPGVEIPAYAIIDQESTESFISEDLRSTLGVDAPQLTYRLTTLDRFRVRKTGRDVAGITVSGWKESGKSFSLPNLISTDQFPDARQKVATPERVRNMPHLRNYADHFLELHPDAKAGILIGSNASELMHVECLGNKAPYVYRSKIGYAVVGPFAGRDDSGIPGEHKGCDHFKADLVPDEITGEDCRVFQADPFDEQIGLSVQDRRFLKIVQNSIRTNDDGKLEIALPYKSDPPTYPRNREAVYRRTEATLRNMTPEKRAGALKFMRATIDKQHVELVPDSERDVKPYFCLPTFAVVHPKKQKVRVVFDAAAQYQGISLNNSLISGPDTNNRLRSVLQKFREKSVALSTDIEAMFHSFALRREDRNVTQFYWPRNSEDGEPLVLYRSSVHIFGATCSPSLAILGLRYAVQTSSDEDVRYYVEKCTYMDDGLNSYDDASDAIRVLTGVRKQLSAYQIHVHKLISNSSVVMDAFPVEEHAEEIRKFGADTEQRTLGLRWRLKGDEFFISGSVEKKAFTKRGCLSTVHAVFDPIGFVAPVVLSGRLFIRAVMERFRDIGWDEPIPEEFRARFETWRQSLKGLSQVTLKRVLIPVPQQELHAVEIHGFSDASEEAIAVSVYVRVVTTQGAVHLSFAVGDSKVAPRAAGSIPRKELCAALLVAKAVQTVESAMMTKVTAKWYHTDSTIVIGWLRNEQKRYRTFVANRVHAIRNITDIGSWMHVKSESNAADLGTREVGPDGLRLSSWISGPPFLRSPDWKESTQDVPVELDLPEEAPEVLTAVSEAEQCASSLSEFLASRFSCWRHIKFAGLALMRMAGKWFSRVLNREPRFQHFASLPCNAESLDAVGNFIVANAQRDVGWTTKSADLLALAPFDSPDHVIRVGGRLRNSPLPERAKHPIVVPSDSAHPIAKRIVEYYHRRVSHQGRHLTGGAVRDAGFFVIHAGQLVRKVINNCVPCRRFRGPLANQMMSDLPKDRLIRSAPFSEVAVDLFGPYELSSIATRRSIPVKAWVMLCTCMYSRAVHTEILTGLDTNTFVNGLRRVMSVRGSIKRIRADHGTNIVGCVNQLDAARRMANQEVDLEFELHAPHASHHGGVVERKILSVQRVLDCTLSAAGPTKMKLDDFSTLVAEATAIVNSTPLQMLTADPDDVPLTPARLLTMKDEAHPPPAGSFTTTDLLSYGTKRWRRTQLLADIFYEKWRQAYLQSLQQRSKWMVPQRSFIVGDVVLMKEKSMTRNRWPWARIKSVKQSDDGRVRTVTLITAGRKEFVRPITELVLLIPQPTN